MLVSNFAGLAFGQSFTLSGRLLDETASPLGSGTVVLLDPSDSTLRFFGITRESGQFEIRYVDGGKYILQASFIGYRSFYSSLGVPREEGTDLGDILLQPLPVNLAGAEVVGEAVPLQIRGDTVEYNAAAFRTTPDAMAEDLLKKMPGIEVDRAGNIKALGEDVRRLYVDGKEFFGSDPTLATRNIPADAIRKVQVYDKRSDAAEFTGIDDGTRDKTMNLELRDETRRGVFGDVLGGYGPGGYYKGSGKVYKFTDRTQMAALGMLNNLNQFGFSFDDYLNFSGGLMAIAHGGSARIRITSDNTFPVNFGQPVDGRTTSGAGGFNLSRSKDLHNRTYMSYLVSGSVKDLDRSTRSSYFTDEGSYTSEEEMEQLSGGMSHRINFGLRRRADSVYSFILGGNITVIDDHREQSERMVNLQAGEEISSLEGNTDTQNGQLRGDMNGIFSRIFSKGKSVLTVTSNGGYRRSLEEFRVNNSTVFGDGLTESGLSLFQDNRNEELDASLSAHFTSRIARGFYLVPQVNAGITREGLDRKQGPLSNGLVPLDTVSPSFSSDHGWIRPALFLKWNTQKTQFSLGVQGESGSMKTSLNGEILDVRPYFFPLPALSYDRSRMTGRRISLDYSSRVSQPAISQLLPTVNGLNPLSVYRGNPSLRPEFNHSLSGHWLVFDQFSFTSFLMAFQAGYTWDKINWSTVVTDSLVRINTLTNVNNDLEAGVNINFSTPIRKLGIKINLDMEEGWNRGISRINGTENTYRTLTQRYSLGADNRDKQKWDVSSGVGVNLTSTVYDIVDQMNSRYFDFNWFGEISFTPGDRWNFQFTGDITSYTDRGFDESILVPLLRSEASFYFLAHRRGVLTLSAHDLLDRDQIVDRLSELDYLRETRSNTIGRYFMLTFKYRLNKIAGKTGMKMEMRVGG